MADAPVLKMSDDHTSHFFSISYKATPTAYIDDYICSTREEVQALFDGLTNPDRLVKPLENYEWESMERWVVVNKFGESKPIITEEIFQDIKAKAKESYPEYVEKKRKLQKQILDTYPRMIVEVTIKECV